MSNNLSYFSRPSRSSSCMRTCNNVSDAYSSKLFQSLLYSLNHQACRLNHRFLAVLPSFLFCKFNTIFVIKISIVKKGQLTYRTVLSRSDICPYEEFDQLAEGGTKVLDPAVVCTASPNSRRYKPLVKACPSTLLDGLQP